MKVPIKEFLFTMKSCYKTIPMMQELYMTLSNNGLNYVNLEERVSNSVFLNRFAMENLIVPVGKMNKIVQPIIVVKTSLLVPTIHASVLVTYVMESGIVPVGRTRWIVPSKKNVMRVAVVSTPAFSFPMVYTYFFFKLYM